MNNSKPANITMHLSGGLVVCLVLLAAEGAMADPPPMAKRGCQDHCGNISIPFPFGIGQKCYMNKWFEVLCNTSSNAHKAFLSGINMELLEISLEESLVRVNGPIQSSNCSNRRTNDDNTAIIRLTGSPYRISSLNRFTAMGCDTRALLNQVKPEITGCTTTCSATSGNSSSCSGNNCCQTTIPTSIQVFNASLEGDSGCKLGFIVEQSWFLHNITSPWEVQHMLTVPVLLDWIVQDDDFKARARVGNGIYCYESDYRQAEGSSSYLEYTYPNSSFCRCSGGYDGNPYLPDGCIDYNSSYEESLTFDSHMIPEDDLELLSYLVNYCRLFVLTWNFVYH
ncbi:hypothetical protein Tsubulata_014298 [Turnera subulata]|uniref:Wall-associated receptor kinase galacturonan-binding domain-containing protein n=1 Tax=Turnera subulata TaxID=218843 RepID=A0A9Q0EZA4_9ROSI|nr:hypothetical protein Tsubulata_014298 [Turnera subulata]